MNRIKSLRVRQRITQKEAALALGVEQSQISQWENGNQIPKSTRIQAIAETYGCSVEEALEAVAEIALRREQRREMEIAKRMADKERAEGRANA